ncbi:hypothetical protein ZWY2020_046600 [Hordeum vulgare]|nr:hypothetical protein ZWY2020_046600 [Hordeum vulgare]
MRGVAMRMHTKDQSSEGEKELRGPSLSELQPNLEAYLRHLVDSKLIFQTLENIADQGRRPMVLLIRFWTRKSWNSTREGTLSDLLQNVREKLNQVASSWTQEEKNRCLEETETSFAYSGERLRKIFT